MNGNNRPLGVTILGFVYVAVGAGGFAAHFNALLGRALWREGVPIAARYFGHAPAASHPS